MTNQSTNKTINYYNQNASAFTSDTVAVDFDEKQNVLLKYLEPDVHILDFGCGSGRDSKAFLQKGYKVTAIDGSSELCKIASEYIGQEVQCMKFHELNEVEAFDAVWACASILHVPSTDLPQVIGNIERALKPGGYFYVSFKHGDFEGERNGRYFTNQTEQSLEELLEPFTQLELLETSVTPDVRVGRGDEMWLNGIVRKR
ncbi:class I SAM-dependent methyltransferase [Ureibacillus acetophenoni]|uniref:Methyltransferase family protein n=1 Tax=Ureibacillus acetophenoni TaxID=614649 RepID=A0A285UHQ9_9BACL|nr:class I SAM-dependent methyltransferase [Ureibacillus acetophenoni]SOC41445.1 methyltransferase family protein [Ureibacillus acetophenoni]